MLVYPHVVLTRLVILGFVAAFMGMLIAIGLEVWGELLPFPTVCFVGAVFGIAWVIWNQIRFKVVNNTLIIQQPLRTAEAIDLDKLAAWRELSYNIRSQTRRTLVLMFGHDRKVFVDNHEYEAEYEELQRLLHHAHLNKKQLSSASSGGSR